MMARRIADAFGLTTAELGDLFGVSRETTLQWIATGFPAPRQAKAAVVLEIARLLDHYLQAGRISAIARRPAEAYGGRTMLEMIAASGHEELLDLTRASVAFGTTV